MPHVVGFAKNSSLRNRAALARACANMCRHVLRASVEPHPITPGEREGGAQEKNTHTNVRRFSLQKQQKIEGWNQQQRRKQESQNQHVWKIGTPTSKSFQAQSNVVVNTKTRVEPDPQFCCCTHEQTYLWTLAIKLFQKSRDKLEKRFAGSQEPTKTADCRKWETDTGNGVHKKQQMKPSSSKHIKKDIHTWVMFTTSLGFKSWLGVPSCQHWYTPKIHEVRWGYPWFFSLRCSRMFPEVWIPRICGFWDVLYHYSNMQLCSVIGLN